MAVELFYESWDSYTRYAVAACPLSCGERGSLSALTGSLKATKMRAKRMG